MKRATPQKISPPLILLLVLLSIAFNSLAANYKVGPGEVFLTPDTINWSLIKPGDVITIQPGTYSTSQGGSSMTISGVAGSAASPIVINALAGQMPKLLNGIVITNAAKHIVIDGLDVTRNPQAQQYAAIVVNGGSSNITLSHLNVHDSYVGINVDQSGLDNKIYSNYIYGNLYHGITLGAPAAEITPAANSQSATFNSVYNNGAHGIEVIGPYWNVSHNKLKLNGASNTGGTSGIHLFSTGSAINASGRCNNNVVSYNYVSQQIDTVAADGNGIQIDDFCDNNTITFNVVWQNDGAGISLLTGSGNKIISNTSYSNARDANRISQYPGVIVGEIILSSRATLCDNPYVNPAYCNVPSGRASNNTIYNNIAYSSKPAAPGLNVAQDFYDASRNSNNIYPNFYYNTFTGVNLIWGSSSHYTATEIDNVTGLSAQGGGNIVEVPGFANASNPGPDGVGSNGLKLSVAPSKQGWIVNPAVPDMLGVLPTSSTYYFGAYYYP
ncbi:parallel beta-helix repeat protein [Variovorax boronicumulans]|uniref:right-handed parallel beta-helix repeat-containing protein n=1 Tax=Variovorax boronicumulans TaxID=436515 RepID=UPI003393EB1B